jgi:SulP family sulfate permease|eukprot:g2150.t1
MDKLFPIVKVVKDRGLLEVAKEALVPSITVLFMLVPQSMAYAILAEVPPIYGLYSSALPLLVYSLLGTSGQVAVGPVAMLALLSAGTINALPGVAPEDTVALVNLLTLLSGIVSLALGALRMGSITHLLSHEVLGGFTTAAAVIIASSQMKYVLGVQIGRHRYPVQTLGEIFSKVPNANVTELLLSIASFVLLLFLKWWKKKHGAPGARAEKPSVAFKVVSIAARFSALSVIGLASIVAGVMTASGASVNIVGKQPSGIPAPTAVLSSSAIVARIPELILPAIPIALIGFAETYAGAKVYDKAEVVEPNKELIALGAANIAGSFFHAIPVAGSIGRAAVNADAGSRTTASNFFTGLGVILVLLVLSPVLEFVPYSALAAIIITSVIGMIKVEAFKKAWKVNRSDFAVLTTTFVATLGLGIELGVGIGTVFSMLNVIRESASPNMPLLGRVDSKTEAKGQQWVDRERFPNAYRPPGNVIIRIDSPLIFVNCALFKRKIVSEVNAINASDDEEKVGSVIVDMSLVTRVDLSGLHALSTLEDMLRTDGIALALVGAENAVQDTFQKWTVASARAPFQQYPYVQNAIEQKKVDIVVDDSPEETKREMVDVVVMECVETKEKKVDEK